LKIFLKIVLISILIIFCPASVNSAEILLIKNSSTILVGDQNRNLTIKLVCVNVNNDDEQKAISLLKREFPRGSKVKIKPYSVREDILFAKVFNIKGTKEMSDILISEDLTTEKCLI